MLVLSRKVGQGIQIGDNVRVTVLRVSGSRVVLGIEAPADVHVLRGELSFDVEGLESTEDKDAACTRDCAMTAA